ncbi:hypothetical protein AB1Y20_001590 [Prymnesium parvum]|uniref:peptidylprolyl isomerase n=1 Tax=Prymnesium parvum TaxID=97485 RepID=A0AB34K8R3_PRYPA
MLAASPLVILSFVGSPPPLSWTAHRRACATMHLPETDLQQPEFSQSPAPEWKRTNGGLKFRVMTQGSGATPEGDDVVTVHYTVSLESGEQLGTSRGRWPLTFALGKQHVPVFDDAVKSMRVGSTIRLVIPASKVPRVQSSNVPKDQEGEPVIAEIELMEIRKGLSAVLPSLLPPGSRRIVILRTLFLLSFVPYFFPDHIKPDFYKFGDPVAIQQAHNAAQNSVWLGGAAKSLDSLFH